MKAQVAGRLTWRKSTLIIAIVTGTLLVLASSAMAANLGLWDQQQANRSRNPLVVELRDGGRSGEPVLRVDGTVTSASGSSDGRSPTAGASTTVPSGPSDVAPASTDEDSGIGVSGLDDDVGRFDDD